MRLLGWVFARRWWIVALIFGASILNYIDRQTLSLLATTIQADLHIDEDGYANIVSAFLVLYTVGLLASGLIVDRLGVRTAFALFVGWWSIANACTSLARSALGLGLSRALLGLGEAGNWTAAAKAVSEHFTPKERALAIGIYTMGASIGATIAPPLVIAMSAYGWRTAFLFTPMLAACWLAAWFTIYRSPPAAPVDAKGVEPVPAGSKVDWRQALDRRDVWCFIIARLLTDPVWYFYQFWFAKYLATDRAATPSEIARSWVVFLAADVGCLAGGLIAGRLIARGAAPNAARLRVTLLCACLVPLSALVPQMTSINGALALSMVIVFAHLMWLVNLSALLVDRFPTASVGTVFGLVAAGSAIGGIFMSKGVAAVIPAHGYTPVFLAMVVVHPVAWLLLRWAMRAPYTVKVPVKAWPVP